MGSEVVGVWRRAGRVVTVNTWRRLSSVERNAIEAEAATMPLPDVGAMVVRWES